MNADELIGGILVGGSVAFVVLGVLAVVVFMILDWLGLIP